MPEHVTPEGPEAWEAFRKSGLLWFVNRILHVFNWSIIVSYDDNDNVIRAWPARTTWKGFSPDMEKAGYEMIEDFLKEEYEDSNE